VIVQSESFNDCGAIVIRLQRKHDCKAIAKRLQSDYKAITKRVHINCTANARQMHGKCSITYKMIVQQFRNNSLDRKADAKRLRSDRPVVSDHLQAIARKLQGGHNAIAWHLIIVY
jgi:hypothetical protein